MVKKIFLWLLAFLITAGAAIYQRSTGPTYPVKGSASILGSEINYKLERSHSGFTNHEIAFTCKDTSLTAYLYYKRFKTDDDFTILDMNVKDSVYSAELPAQPPAGKLEYFVKIKKGNSEELLTDDTIVIRFKGEVPPYYLVPHIIFMFAAMMFASAVFLSIFMLKERIKVYSLITIILLFVGGLILGPIVQYYAFGEFWTGFPYGHDLTDNKTLIAFLVWVFCYLIMLKSKKVSLWAFIAVFVMYATYLIPHSTWGSELDYKKLDKQQNKLKQEVLNDN